MEAKGWVFPCIWANSELIFRFAKVTKSMSIRQIDSMCLALWFKYGIWINPDFTPTPEAQHNEDLFINQYRTAYETEINKALDMIENEKRNDTQNL